MKILVSWIGNTDLKVLLDDANASIVSYVQSKTRSNRTVPASSGPIITMLLNHSFDKVHFLSTYPKNVTKAFLKRLPVNADITYADVKNPTDYSEIFKYADTFLSDLANTYSSKERELSILLSPGTPTMAAIWVLLGKTKYPATFWQTWDSQAKKESIPFDITVDVVPELLSGQASILNELSNTNPQDVQGFEDITGETKAIRIAVGRARKAALYDVPVLLTGESGTGKEMFARAIHKSSTRCQQPFVTLNCAAIPDNLLESELFGHIKGAFTGAAQNRAGAFKRADGGTLFLDEIGECGPQLQTKLLRVLQPTHGQDLSYREFTPVGSEKAETSNVRVLAATNRNLMQMIEENTFRSDLFYRISVVNIKLPSLRDRRADIPLLSAAILNQINTSFSKQNINFKQKVFSDSTMTFIKKLYWQGNIRELYNVILQSVAMCETDTIKPEDIKAALVEAPDNNKNKDLINQPIGNGFVLKDLLNSIHCKYLRRALSESNGNKTEAAKLLGLKSYQALDEQMRRLEVTSY